MAKQRLRLRFYLKGRAVNQQNPNSERAALVKGPGIFMDNEIGEGLICGRNAVMEALKSGRAIDTIYIQRGTVTGSLSAIVAKAKAAGVSIKEVDSKKLDFMSKNSSHQGIVAVAAVKEYAEIPDILALARERGEAPFVIICDELTDPHNLGAILRTAECAGAHGVIIPKRRSVGLTYTVGKASAGAVEYVPVVRVNNISSALDELKELGLWVYTADMDGKAWCEVDYTGGVALVIGSEGSGVGRLIREKSDFIVSLPIRGKINSLNASVACGVICYEIARQRGGLGVK